MATGRMRPLMSSILAATFAAGATVLATGSAEPAGPAAVLRFGITAGVVEGSSPTDAKAASQLWAQGIAEAIGLYRAAESSYYADMPETVRAVASGQIDVLALSSLEFLAAEDRLKCRPAMVYEVNGEVMQEFVLIARTGVQIGADAARKSLVVYAPTKRGSLPDVWADVHFREAGLREGVHSFASVRYVDKRSHAAMAVFFKQADFAIESRSALMTAIDLNPQLGKELVVLAQSPPLLPGLVCMSHTMSADLQRKYVDRAAHLHEQPRYRQAFVVMRVTRITEFQLSYLDTARALLAKQRALVAKR